MPRYGYLIVERDDDLFPKSVSIAIEARSRSILAAVERQQHVRISGVPFQVAPITRSKRTLSQISRSLFSSDVTGDIRVLYHADPPDVGVLTNSFVNTDLLVTVQPARDQFPAIRAGSTDGNPCHIVVPIERAPRIIEDMIIDISLGTLFRATAPIRELVTSEGLVSLFRRKAEFFRANVVRSWISSIERGAGYAPLSSLNDIADSDIEGRAQRSFEAWREFARSLTHTVTATQLERSDLAALPVVGGQLPLKRIAAAARNLPDGDYTLLVLRRSMARKSPSIRKQLSELFRARARVNSFRFAASDQYMRNRATAKELHRSGHIYSIQIVILNGEVRSRED